MLAVALVPIPPSPRARLLSPTMAWAPREAEECSVRCLFHRQDRRPQQYHRFRNVCFFVALLETPPPQNNYLTRRLESHASGEGSHRSVSLLVLGTALANLPLLANFDDRPPERSTAPGW